MVALAQVGLIAAGPLFWFITKNQRWMILFVVGVAWTAFDVVVLALSIGS